MDRRTLLLGPLDFRRAARRSSTGTKLYRPRCPGPLQGYPDLQARSRAGHQAEGQGRGPTTVEGHLHERLGDGPARMSRQCRASSRVGAASGRVSVPR